MDATVISGGLQCSCLKAALSAPVEMNLRRERGCGPGVGWLRGGPVVNLSPVGKLRGSAGWGLEGSAPVVFPEVGLEPWDCCSNPPPTRLQDPAARSWAEVGLEHPALPSLWSVVYLQNTPSLSDPECSLFWTTRGFHRKMELR